MDRQLSVLHVDKFDIPRLSAGANRRVEERGAARPVAVQERWPPTNQTWRERRCYECGKLGHLLMWCPSKALSGEGRGAGGETTNRGEAVLFTAQVWSTGRQSQTLFWIQGVRGRWCMTGWFQLDRCNNHLL